MDDTGYFNYPLGATKLDEKMIAAFALPYATVGSIMRDWARIASTHPTWGAAKPDDGSDQSTTLGDWKITASWGQWQFGMKDWTWIKADPTPWGTEPVGGVAVAQLSDSEYLVMGDHVRVSFSAANGRSDGMIVSVEEGTFKDGKWVMSRVWNGDQTDYGLNLIDRPQVLKITTGFHSGKQR
jgi:beta-galactosidase GanA